jgi:BASS family bile acid:Na+ symporter
MVTYLLAASIIFLMLGVGLHTPPSQVVDVAKQPRLLIRGVVANFLIVPLLFYLALELFSFRPDVVIGLLIMAAVPIAPMAPPFVDMARGDVAYAVGLMVIAALLCVPLTPLILVLSLPRSEAGLELESARIIQMLLSVQLLPIGLGMAINRFSRAWTERLSKVVPAIGRLGLVITVFWIVAERAGAIIELGVWPNLAVLLSLVACLMVGDVMMLGESSERRRSLGISTAIRNVGLGLLIANSNYAGTPAVAIVLSFGLLSMVASMIYGRLEMLQR